MYNFIITVHTPIDRFKNLNLKPLINASTLVGNYLKKGDIFFYESTVYHGCIEEVCEPILQKERNLIHN